MPFLIQITREGHNMILQWHHMGVMVSQITDKSSVRSTVCPGVHQRKHQSSALLARFGGSTAPGGFTSQKASNVEKVPCHDVFMTHGSNRHNSTWYNVTREYLRIRYDTICSPACKQDLHTTAPLSGNSDIGDFKSVNDWRFPQFLGVTMSRSCLYINQVLWI